MKKFIWILILPFMIFACEKENGKEDVKIPLTLEKSSLKMDKGESGTILVNTGNGKYSVTVNQPEIASATISGQSVAITAKQYGSCTVTVSDAGGEKASISVTVSAKSMDNTARRFTYKENLIVFGQTAGWSISGKNDKEVEIVSVSKNTSLYMVWKNTSTVEIKSYNNGKEHTETLSVENVGKDAKGFTHYLFEGGELVN